MEITITRALSELKTLKSKYEKELSNNFEVVAVKQGDKLFGDFSHIKEDDFIKRAKSKMQSVNALYNRYIAIKTAIDKSNFSTIVKIGNKEMTVSEALVYKSTLEMREYKLSRLKRISSNTKDDYRSAENQNNTAIERMISSTIGKDGTDTQKKSAREEAENYINKTKSLSLVDPCDIDNLIEELENEIIDFKTNVDYALSESNSTTKIIIPD